VTMVRVRKGFAFLGNCEVKANLAGDVEGSSTYMRASDHNWDTE
jgi:hypothetical protein